MSFLRLPLAPRAPRGRRATTSVTRKRTISATQGQAWGLIEDPHQLPRWWPRMVRVEDVREERWTELFMTQRGRPVRVDQRLLVSEPSWRRSWQQELHDTPFARFLAESITEVTLASVPEGTLVTIALHQKLRGYSRTGGLLVRRVTAKRLDQALDGLADAVTGES